VYVREDAFIEKALKFIKTNVDRIVNNQHGVCMGCMDEEFRKYMKGE
jgi:mannitol-1-phosphate/altronate dehydrogenase